jgi:hypothetical protein
MACATFPALGTCDAVLLVATSAWGGMREEQMDLLVKVAGAYGKAIGCSRVSRSCGNPRSPNSWMLTGSHPCEVNSS